ncbi:MAG: type II CAAX endopeptidase family protein [Verrucomicrobiota bacterium]
MSDPSYYVFLTCLSVAVLVFLGSWIFHQRRPQAVLQPLEGQDVPYDPGNLAPPQLPVGKVIVWPFHVVDIVGIALISAVFVSLVFLGLETEATHTTELSPTLLISNIIFQFGLAGMVMLAMMFRVRISQWLGLRWKRWAWIFLIAPGMVVGMLALFALLQVVGYMDWMESLGVETMQDTVKLLRDSKDPMVLALMAVAAVVVAPLCEEIVFRGYIYGAAKKFTGAAGAAVFSALVFSVAHGSVAALLPLFLLGLAFVWIYEKTGSIWAPIAVHFCFNGATVAVQLLARAGILDVDA